MKTMNMNAFTQDVHRNAVAHGWWDEERSPGTIRSLFHAELSEALEAYRNHETLVWHKCRSTTSRANISRCRIWQTFRAANAIRSAESPRALPWS